LLKVLAIIQNNPVFLSISYSPVVYISIVKEGLNRAAMGVKLRSRLHYHPHVRPQLRGVCFLLPELDLLGQ
jgi:hypothetical protein